MAVKEIDTPTNEKLTSALERVKTWMLENNGTAYVKNLKAGATEKELQATEKKLGFPLPPELSDLWRLHNGQKGEDYRFVDSLCFMGTRWATGELENVLLFVRFLREHPDDWNEAGVTEQEVMSDRWVPFAGLDSDYLLVSGVSGRVFACRKDSPPLHLTAKSMTAWATAYAKKVEAGGLDLECDDDDSDEVDDDDE